MYFSDTSEVNYAIAKYALYKNKGDIFSLKNDINISTKNIEFSCYKKTKFQ